MLALEMPQGQRGGAAGGTAGTLCGPGVPESPRQRSEDRSGTALPFPLHCGPYGTSLELQRRGIPAGSRAEPSKGLVLNPEPGNDQPGMFVQRGMFNLECLTWNVQPGVFNLQRGSLAKQRQQPGLPALCARHSLAGALCELEKTPGAERLLVPGYLQGAQLSRGFCLFWRCLGVPVEFWAIICQWVYAPQ